MASFSFCRVRSKKSRVVRDAREHRHEFVIRPASKFRRVRFDGARKDEGDDDRACDQRKFLGPMRRRLSAPSGCERAADRRLGENHWGGVE
jgi:hypothetical protein